MAEAWRIIQVRLTVRLPSGVDMYYTCGMEHPKTIIFQGRRYNRDRNNYYHRGGGQGALHRAIWESRHGPIPKGYHIHHVDGDKFNNRVTNLQCLTATEHNRIHQRWQRENPKPRSEKQKAADISLGKAHAVWAKSDEGRRHLQDRGARIIASRPMAKKICEVCGKTYKTNSLKKDARRCSGRCNAKARRDSGVDDITVTCRVCGVAFMKNKYFKKITCGPKCGAAFRWRHT